MSKRRVLVIKLGALGDFVLATSAFADIRAREKDSHITLLTTPMMRAFAEGAPWFDEVVYDKRKKMWHLGYILDLRKKLQGFDFVYDLQTNQRSGIYFKLAGKPQWSGIACGCSHPHDNPNRNNMHTLDRLAEQLTMADVKPESLPDISYAKQNADDILTESGLMAGEYVALVAGASKKRPAKRWPHFDALAKKLLAKGQQVVLLGGPDEIELLHEIEEASGAKSLAGKTSIPQLLDILAKAKVVVGNDTGPMHMAAAVNAKCLVLFGEDSVPELCAPRGNCVEILRKLPIAAISTHDVMAELDKIAE